MSLLPPIPLMLTWPVLAAIAIAFHGPARHRHAVEQRAVGRARPTAGSGRGFHGKASPR